MIDELSSFIRNQKKEQESSQNSDEIAQDYPILSKSETSSIPVENLGPRFELDIRPINGTSSAKVCECQAHKEQQGSDRLERDKQADEVLQC